MKLYVILGVIFTVFGAAQLHPLEAVTNLLSQSENAWGYEQVYERVNLFWWLFFANPSFKLQRPDRYDKPLLIWLGFYSTADTNFNQYGPFDIDLERRNYSLVNDFNILFIDSIAGAGFSYAENDTLYASDTHITSYDLLTCIKQILIKFPAFKSTPMYIVADSFFGKIAPELALLWNNAGKDVKGNLQGVIVGNPLISPLPSKTWSLLRERMLKIKTPAISNDDQLNFSVEKGWHWMYNEIKKIFNYCTDDLCESKMKVLPDYSEDLITDLLSIAVTPKLNFLMNDHIKTSLELITDWELTESGNFITKLRNQIVKPVLAALFDRLLRNTTLKVIIFNTQLDFKIKDVNSLSWIDEIHWTKHIKRSHKPLSYFNKILGWKSSYENLDIYTLTKYNNPDFKTNSEFFAHIFKENNLYDVNN